MVALTSTFLVRTVSFGSNHFFWFKPFFLGSNRFFLGSNRFFWFKLEPCGCCGSVEYLNKLFEVSLCKFWELLSRAQIKERYSECFKKARRYMMSQFRVDSLPVCLRRSNNVASTLPQAVSKRRVVHRGTEECPGRAGKGAESYSRKSRVHNKMRALEIDCQ